MMVYKIEFYAYLIPFQIKAEFGFFSSFFHSEGRRKNSGSLSLAIALEIVAH